MEWTLIAIFFGGLLVANGMPHFIEGICGRAFQTPFARPPGKGYSSSLVNVLWGISNFAAGYALLFPVAEFEIGRWPHAIAALAGAATIGVILAKVFGDIHGGTRPQER